MAKKLYEESNIQAIADAIRAKTGSANTMKVSEFAGKINSISSGGGDNYYDTFWDAFQENGNRANYQRGFYMWPGAAFNPKYGINGTLLEAFYSSTVTSVEVPIVVGSNSAQSAFYKCINLVSIESIDITGVTSTQNMFYSCTSLEEIRFAGTIETSLSFAQSPNLSVDSVQSILDHLKDLTGATKQTITFNKAMESKVTPTQKQAIFAKNWEQVY